MEVREILGSRSQGWSRFPLLGRLHELDRVRTESVGSGLRNESESTEFDAILDRTDLIPFGASESRRAARLQRQLQSEGHPVGAIDVMIAATALEHGRGVVTRNVSEFNRIDDARVSPY